MCRWARRKEPIISSKPHEAAIITTLKNMRGSTLRFPYTLKFLGTGGDAQPSLYFWIMSFEYQELTVFRNIALEKPAF
jgi:hypothetical protein